MRLRMLDGKGKMTGGQFKKRKKREQMKKDSRRKNRCK